MKAKRLFITGGLMFTVAITTSCEKDDSGDTLYGIDKKEIKERDTRIFEKSPGIMAIDKKEIKERDT